MFKFLNFLKPKPKPELGVMKNVRESFRQKNRPDGVAGVYFDFRKELFEEDILNWTPEETEKRIKFYQDKITALCAAENERNLNELSNEIRSEIMAGKYNIKFSDTPTDLSYPATPLRPTKEIRQGVNERADKRKFG